MKTYGFYVFAFIIIEISKIDQADCHIRRMGSKDFFPDNQSALVKKFRFSLFALIIVETCQIMQGFSHIGMLRAEGFLSYG
jgi:hypothetical protein